jgi:hypothetical protein
MILTPISKEQLIALLDERIDLGFKRYMHVSPQREDDSLLTVKETAAALGLCTVTLRKYSRLKIIPSYSVPGTRLVRFKKQEVIDALKTIKSVKHSRNQI